MSNLNLFDEIKIVDNVLPKGNTLFDQIKDNTIWDTSIRSRETSSYGEPYNYSNLNYEFAPFPKYILEIATIVNREVGFLPNNCLINFYRESKSKMGFHSDQIDILQDKTGIVIISLGNERIIRFKNKIDKEIIHDIVLKPNSLFFMTSLAQEYWLHAILPDEKSFKNQRISITFRKLKI